MTKEHILQEIKRTAVANGGRPLGWRKFAKETGIRDSDWLGKHWARWGEAVREAGYTPNQMIEAYEDAELFEKFIQVARELTRLPTDKDLRLKAHHSRDFPDAGTFTKFGRKAELVRRVLEYCRAHDGYADIIVMCEGHIAPQNEEKTEEQVEAENGFCLPDEVS